MIQLRRYDEPGAYFHVGNRALAHRTMFEDARDRQRFERCVASVVRRRLIDVDAIAILTTHFHMLVQSLDGRLSAALRDLESEYVLGFNERHDRDGPLVTGPFFSTRLFDDDDIHRTVRYIDFNAVVAGLARHPFDYENGSAFHYARDSVPEWMRREVVEAMVRAHSTRRTFDAQAYGEVFLSEWTSEEFENERWGLKVRQRSRALGRGPWDLTVEKVRAWLRERCSIADGRPPGYAAPNPDTVDAVWVEAMARAPDWRIATERANLEPWKALRIGLLRDVACARLSEIETTVRCSAPRLTKLYARHRRLILGSMDYAERAAILAATALARRGTGLPRP